MHDENIKELPNKYFDPKSNEEGVLIKEKTIGKIYTIPKRTALKYVKVGVYQKKDGSTFEVQFDKNDPFGTSACTPELASFLTYLKCCLYLPNDRIQKMFETQGTPISKQLQYKYLSKTSDFLEKVYDRIGELLLERDVLHADETTFNNLDPAANNTNYVWAMSSARFDPFQAVYYCYKNDRKHVHAEEMFRKFNGTIISDRYNAYSLDNATNAYCWAHARRKFSDYLKVAEKNTQDYKDIEKLFRLINKMFAIENEFVINKLTDNQILQKRNEEKASR